MVKGWLSAIDRHIAVAVGVEHLLGDRAEGVAEMIRRFHHDDALLRRIDADIGEELAAERLVAMGDEHHLDAIDADRGAIAELGLGRAEGLHGVAAKPDHFDLGIDRRAGFRPALAAEAKLETRALADREAEAHRDRIPKRAHRRVGDAFLEKQADHVGIVRRRPSSGIVGRVRDHGGAVVARLRLAERFLLRQELRREPVELLDDLSRERGGKLVAFGFSVIGDHEHARADIGHVGMLESMAEGDGEHAGC